MGFQGASLLSVPRFATLGMLVTLVAANDPQATQPPKTAALRLQRYAVHPGPAPTKLPAANADILGRAVVDTCGYAYGDVDQPWTCAEGGRCFTDQAWNVVDCCQEGDPNCVVQTTCIDYRSSIMGWCSGIGSRTACCGQEENPFCAVMTFEDKPILSIVGCKASTDFVNIYASPTTSTTTDTTTSSTSVSLPISSSTTPPTPPISSPTTTTTSTPTTTPAPSDSPPIGAIVGGALGGVAIVSLAAALIVWLVLRHRRHTANPAEPPMQQPYSTETPQSPSACGYPDPVHHPGHLSFGSWGGITAGLTSDVSSPGGDNYKFQQPVTVAGLGGGDQLIGGGQQDLPHYQPGLYTSELPAADVEERPGHGQN